MSATTGAAPPSCAWPNASLLPCSARKAPSGWWQPSETTTVQKPCFFTSASTRPVNVFSSNGISGNSTTTGMPSSSTSPPAAAIQPACRPITSSTNTLVEVLAMDRTSNEASSVDTATYLATEPNPGQQSVIGRSLSTVLGTWMAWIG